MRLAGKAGDTTYMESNASVLDRRWTRVQTKQQVAASVADVWAALEDPDWLRWYRPLSDFAVVGGGGVVAGSVVREREWLWKVESVVDVWEEQRTLGLAARAFNVPGLLRTYHRRCRRAVLRVPVGAEGAESAARLGLMSHHGERVEFVDLDRSRLAEVRSLILSGLEEHWGELDPTLNGTGTIRPVGDEQAEIIRMSVAATARRTGLGAQIVEVLVDTARGWGCHSVVLETTSTWTGAIAFYQRCGFTVTGTEVTDVGEDTWFVRPL